ncbi:MAG: poly-beta-1,6-N-acetyl-D-glucosamine N-deacetylase PgaB [archaeon]
MKYCVAAGLIFLAVVVLLFVAADHIHQDSGAVVAVDDGRGDFSDSLEVGGVRPDAGGGGDDDGSFEGRPLYFVQIDAQDVVNKGADAVIADLVAGGVNTVVLQVFSDDDEVGVYWNSKIAPVREDILSEFVSLSHDNGLSVFVWMTTLDMPWVYDESPDMRMKAYVDGRMSEDTGWYRRISPTVVQHREYIADVFREIAMNYDIDGILLQDDLYWGSDEVFDDFTREAYLDDTGRELTADVVDDPSFHEWKAGWLTAIVRAINDEVKAVRPDVRLAVNVYAECALSLDWCLPDFGQDYRALAINSDYMAIMAYHVMAGEEPSWVGDVTRSALSLETESKETIIKAQVVDWDKDADIDAGEVKGALVSAKRAGAKNIGFYISGRTMSEMGIDFRELG